jgi:hypothetical protein
MENALYTLAATGNPMNVLFEYCHLIRKYDIADDEIAYEGHHRDSIWMVAREYPAIKPMTKYQMTKVRSLLIPRISNVKLTYVVG